MADYGASYTDAELKKLEKKIGVVYKQAEADIKKKMKDFNAKYKVKEAKHLKELADGKITQEQFDSWKKGQIFQGKQWQAKKDQLADTLLHANETATKIMNGQMTNVFAVNANFMSYSLEQGAGVNFGFGIYDSATVSNLLKADQKLLPEWKINEKKDYTWNNKRVNRVITQGIIQGERLDQIANRLTDRLITQNKNKMMTFARTSMTCAQNAGREYSLRAAKDLGINVEKEWMCTLDGRTRDWHRRLDGQKVPVNKSFEIDGLKIRYPGDPEAKPGLVYNCRCTMVGDIVDYPATYNRYDNIDGKPVKGMSYKEWAEAKAKGEDISPQPPSWKKSAKIPKPIDAELSKFKTTEEWLKAARNNPDVRKMLDIEKDAFKKLTQDEIDALITYTGSAYEEMNAYLRYLGAGMSKEEAISRSFINKGLVRDIGHCKKALTKTKLDRDMVLRRGTDTGDIAGLFMKGDFAENKRALSGMTAEELNKKFKGQAGTYHGFTSTSSQWDRGFDGDVECVIYAPKGTKASSIMSISQFGTSEGETLLDAGTKVVCEKIEKSDRHMGSRIRVFLRIIN